MPHQQKTTPVQYTSEQTAQLLQLYVQGVSLEEIAQLLNKSTRSIISKLVQQNAYQPPPQETRRLKKSEMISQIAQALELPTEELESLNKATHPALCALWARVVP